VLVRSLFGVRRVNPSADLDEQTLTTIAEGTGGQYFRARDIASFERIYEILDELEPAASEESGFRPVVEYFHWPLAGAALLVIAWALAAVVGATRAQPLGELEHA
jgi:Ca-activated chloride channel family protein